MQGNPSNSNPLPFLCGGWIESFRARQTTRQGRRDPTEGACKNFTGLPRATGSPSKAPCPRLSLVSPPKSTQLVRNGAFHPPPPPDIGSARGCRGAASTSGELSAPWSSKMASSHSPFLKPGRGAQRCGHLVSCLRG